MSQNNELEDSLRACEEIRKRFEKSEWQTDTSESDVLHSKAPMSGEIDEILSHYQNPQQKIETNPEPEIETNPEPEMTPIAEISPQKEESEDRNKQHPHLKTIFSIVVCIFTALVLALLVTKFIAHHTSVEGSSMEPALTDGDQIIVENISYYFHEPERFDVVVFPNSEGVNYIKRIIGLPGETVRITDGNIYINGELLDENYGDEPLEDPGIAAADVTLGEDEFFVLGDNRNGSIDSRRPEVGKVHRDTIHGKAWMRFYPFTKAGNIE